MSRRGYIRDLLEDGWIKEQRFECAKMNGRTLDALDRSREDRQNDCTHRKGGLIRAIKNDRAIGKALANGDSQYYAVIKHMHMNGDIWVECLRCNKRWKPPVKPVWYKFWKMYQYFADRSEYEKALAFDTNNGLSSSVQCRWLDKHGQNVDTTVIRKMMAVS